MNNKTIIEFIRQNTDIQDVIRDSESIVIMDNGIYRVQFTKPDYEDEDEGTEPVCWRLIIEDEDEGIVFIGYVWSIIDLDVILNTCLYYSNVDGMLYDFRKSFIL